MSLKRKAIICNYEQIVSVIPIEIEAGIVCLLIAAAGILPVMLTNSGYFALSNDFIAQGIPFGMLMNDAIKSGSLWNWAIDLGGNYLEAFGYYNIGSPFFLISLLFPAELYPKLIGWIFMLKFACSGVSSSIWMKRHLSGRRAVLIGAILYTFSGAQCINIVFYHFQDVMALFPFMMVGLEKLVEEKKRGYFALACAVNMLCNPIFFFASAIFVILYFVISYCIPLRNVATTVKLSLSCMLEGLAGAMMGAVTAIPMFLSMMTNSRATDKLPITEWFIMPLERDLIRFMAFFLPAESMNTYSVLCSDNWQSWGAYLPLFGMVFIIAYIIKKRDRFSLMAIVCLIIAFVPVLNSSFIAFSNEQYGRWLFMMDLICACITAKVCDNLEQYKNEIIKSSKLTIALLLCYTLLMTMYVKRSDLFSYHVLVSLFSAIIVLQIASNRDLKKPIRLLVAGTAIASMVLFGASVGGYSFQKADNTKIDFQKFSTGCAESAVTYLTEIPLTLQQDIGPYRYYFDEGIENTYYNLNMTNNLSSINSFISTCHSSITEFYNYLGYSQKVMTPAASDEVKNLLGAKYIFKEVTASDYVEGKVYANANGQIFSLSENLDAIPIGGLQYDCYITESEFLSLDSDLAAAIMLRCMVVKDADEEIVQSKLHHVSPSDSLAEGIIHYTDVSDFKTGRNQFNVRVTTDSSGYVFFSVPYDRFWNCTVNGEAVEILNVNGLITIPASEGDNTVSFKYYYSPMKWICVLTITGIVLCTGMCLSNRTKKTKAK